MSLRGDSCRGGPLRCSHSSYDVTCLQIEVHILGEYAEDFYGEQLKVTVLGFVRPEIKFNGLDELVNRIFQDIGIAKQQLDSDAAQQWRTHSFFR